MPQLLAHPLVHAHVTVGIVAARLRAHEHLLVSTALAVVVRCADKLPCDSEGRGALVEAAIPLRDALDRPVRRES